MKWRKLNNILHRDIGYLCVGLTIMYAISGVAVNHTHNWNPNLKISHYTVTIEPVAAETLKDRGTIDNIMEQLGTTEPVKSTFRPDRETLQIFMENSNVSLNIISGEARIENQMSRYGLHEMNYLHLNRPKGIWTWFADLYAVALFTLAVTGIFVLKGKRGFSGRGKWLISAGTIIPIIFLFIYFY
ncbi:MAG: hypothetical protein GY863_01890 [bacterium]|nr:hypothetical protein [bacterium]